MNWGRATSLAGTGVVLLLLAVSGSMLVRRSSEINESGRVERAFVVRHGVPVVRGAPANLPDLIAFVRKTVPGTEPVRVVHPEGDCKTSVSGGVRLWVTYQVLPHPVVCGPPARWLLYVAADPQGTYAPPVGSTVWVISKKPIMALARIPAAAPKIPRNIHVAADGRFGSRGLGNGAGLAGGSLLLLLAGHGVLRCTTLSRERWAFGLLSGIGLSYLAGVVVHAWLVTILGVAGARVDVGMTGPILASLGICGLVLWARQGRRSETRSMRDRLASIPAGLASVGWGAFLAHRTAASLTRLNDEYAIWSLRGRSLALAKRLDPRIIFGTRIGDYAHPDYPLLVPSLMVWGGGWGGRDAGAHLQVGLLCAAMLLVIAGEVGRRCGPLAALTGVLAVGALPNLGAFASRFYADVPLLAFAVATTLMLVRWIEDRETSALALATVFLLGCFLTKNEGILFGASAVGATAIALLPDRGAIVRLLAFAGVAVLLFMPWVIDVRAHGATNDVINAGSINSSAVKLERIPEIVAGIVQHWPGPRGAVLALLPLAVAIAVIRGRSRIVAMLFGTVVFATVGMAGVYLIHYRGVEGMLRVSASRVLLFPGAVALLAVPLLAGGRRKLQGESVPAASPSQAAGHSRSKR